jgi:hypothetical protein
MPPFPVIYAACAAAAFAVLGVTLAIVSVWSNGGKPKPARPARNGAAQPSADVLEHA